MLGFLNGLNGTLATALICALLFVDEAGLPLPLAPNEVLLLLGGLLIGTGALLAWVFLPLALLAMAGGMLTGFLWARALGTEQLGALARRIHAEKTYEKATTRLRTTGALGIGLTRMLPGVRTYATLVAGAAHIDLRRFLTGALPALAAWLGVLTAIGAVAGLPAEHLISRVDAYLVSGFLLVALGFGSVLAVRKIPRAELAAAPLAGVPGGVRLGLALSVDLGIVAALIGGVERFVARLLHPGHPLGRVNDIIVVVASVLILYVFVCRWSAGATLGEGLFAYDYRSALARRVHVHPTADDLAEAEAQIAAAISAPLEPAEIRGHPSSGARQRGGLAVGSQDRREER